MIDRGFGAPGTNTVFNSLIDVSSLASDDASLRHRASFGGSTQARFREIGNASASISIASMTLIAAAPSKMFKLVRRVPMRGATHVRSEHLKATL